MEAVISFLAIFMPITLVKRVLSLVLIAAGIDNKNINRLTGYGECTIRKLKSDMRKKSLSEILTIRGGGRKAKSADVEKRLERTGRALESWFDDDDYTNTDSYYRADNFDSVIDPVLDELRDDNSTYDITISTTPEKGVKMHISSNKKEDVALVDTI